jgi:acyl-CoA synthetase (AMP-forming)/AMP-acid ligase II
MTDRTTHLEVPDISLTELVLGSLDAADRERTALVDGVTGERLSYGQLADGVERVAAALAERGVRPGDVVALHSPNTPSFALAFFGVLRAGAVVTPVNVLSTARDVEAQLRDAQAVLLVTVAALLPQSGPAAAAVGLAADAAVVLDGADGRPDLDDLLRSTGPAPDVAVDPGSVAVLPYSSGTTGLPKGVRLSHRNLVANALQSSLALDVRADDVVPAVLPFFHIYGLTVLLDVVLLQRATLVTLARFDLGDYLRLVEQHRASYLFIAPPVALALAKHPAIDEHDLSSVRSVLSGAAPLDADLLAAVGARLGARARQGYGMTEASPVTHVAPFDRDDLSPGSVGLPVPGTEARVVSIETGADVPVPDAGMGDRGELWVRGPQVMLGYLDRDDETRATVDADGWLHTGDVVTVDHHGATFVVDRLKELIKYKGYQVAPAELEGLLLGHPDVRDAAVVPGADAEGQEIPAAFVVLVPGAELDERAVTEWVAARVAPHKKVRAVTFVDSVPRSASGKILRRQLRETVGGTR